MTILTSLLLGCFIGGFLAHRYAGPLRRPKTVVAEPGDDDYLRDADWWKR